MGRFKIFVITQSFVHSCNNNVTMIVTWRVLYVQTCCTCRLQNIPCAKYSFPTLFTLCAVCTGWWETFDGEPRFLGSWWVCVPDCNVNDCRWATVYTCCSGLSCLLFMPYSELDLGFSYFQLKRIILSGCIWIPVCLHVVYTYTSHHEYYTE